LPRVPERIVGAVDEDLEPPIGVACDRR
jgi:hypothetical protein